MKKIKNFMKKLNNNGSSLIMVIVSLAFIGIVVGALLTAAGYAYRLKLQDLNARDNFYYLEQAMNEIYAGVGSETVDEMKQAYLYTVDNMVYYDTDTKSYRTKDDEVANAMFQDKFMTAIGNNLTAGAFFNPAFLASNLEALITNDTVTLDTSKVWLNVEKDNNGNITNVIIEDVTLTRTQVYKNSVAGGTYTQTIAADIEIAKPEFTVLFNTNTANYDNIFQYAMVADMGVEFNDAINPVRVTGNLYAASDYYNKKHNQHDATYTGKIAGTILNTTINDYDTKYTHSSVVNSSYEYKNVMSNKDYDGEDPRSMYSGLYIDNSDLSILAETIIVPGSISVMNEGTLSVYGKNGDAVSEAEIWADDLVLGGTSTVKTDADTGKKTYTGAQAHLRAELFIRDDTELNAAGSTLKLIGSYYGYGDSTSADPREYVSTVDKNNFLITDTLADGSKKQYSRDHYNSSAIVINGQQSNLDLSSTKELYLGGRAYIELSKYVDNSGSTDTTYTESYEFVPTSDEEQTDFYRDFKTGESISVKTNQSAYIIPRSTLADGKVGNRALAYVDADGNAHNEYRGVFLKSDLVGSFMTTDFFPSYAFTDLYLIPCVEEQVTVNGMVRNYIYYDFEAAYYLIKATASTADWSAFETKYPTWNDYATAFIVAYSKELNTEESDYVAFLEPLAKPEDFEMGDVTLPSTDNPLALPVVYSSGALTAKKETNFSITLSSDYSAAGTNKSAIINSLLTDYHSPSLTGANVAALQLSYEDELVDEYNYIKWNLGHYSAAEVLEETYVDIIASVSSGLGESVITPINKFLDMSKITATTNIQPNLTGAAATTDMLELPSGYSVWVANGDVEVKAAAGQSDVRGIVVAKGDVYFDSAVTSFEGLLIAGGKIYTHEKPSTDNPFPVTYISSISANPEICRRVIQECNLMSSNANASLVLELFRHKATTSDQLGNTDSKEIDTIDYTDIVRYSNWMKNVE